MSNEIVIERPDTSTLARHGTALMERAKALTIHDIVTHSVALEFLRDIADAQNAVHDLCDPMTRALDAAHKEGVRMRRRLLDPLQAARTIVGAKCTTYTEEERRKAEAERRRLEAEARKAEEERLLTEAQVAEESGDRSLADEILSAPPPPVYVAPAVAAVAGVFERETWSAEIVDKAALVRFVADHYDDWQHLVEPVATQLNALARAQRGLMRIPGVRAVSKVVQSVRTM